jgi:hypothetical protein
MTSLYDALELRDTTASGYRSISFSRIPIDSRMLHHVLPLWRITDVHIKGSTGAKSSPLDTIYELMTLFASMPNLQTLSLDAVRRLQHFVRVEEVTTSDGTPTFEGSILLPQLRALRIHDCDAKSILRPLSIPPVLREVDVACTEEEALWVGSFLRSLW